MAVAFLAASKSGVVALPLNWRLAPVEWQHILAQGGARLLIAQAEFARRVRRSAPAASSKPRTSWTADAKAGTTTGPGSRRSRTRRRRQKATTASPCTRCTPAARPASPRAAVIAHHAVITNALQAMLVFEPRFSPQDRALIVMPMFHAGAASFVVGTLMTGATMVIHREFNAGRRWWTRSPAASRSRTSCQRCCRWR